VPSLFFSTGKPFEQVATRFTGQDTRPNKIYELRNIFSISANSWVQQ